MAVAFYGKVYGKLWVKGCSKNTTNNRTGLVQSLMAKLEVDYFKFEILRSVQFFS